MHPRIHKGAAVLTILPDAGLFLDMAGAAVVGYASTKPVYAHWTGTLIQELREQSGEVLAETSEIEIQPTREHARWLRIGWGLIALGFLLQLIG